MLGRDYQNYLRNRTDQREEDNARHKGMTVAQYRAWTQEQVRKTQRYIQQRQNENAARDRQSRAASDHGVTYQITKDGVKVTRH